MAIELKLYKTDDDVRTVKRDDANVIEMQKFFELQTEVSEGLENKTMNRIEQTNKTIEYLAFLFKDQDVSEQDLKEGIKAKEFDEVVETVFRQISPSDYERIDRIKAVKAAEQKSKLAGTKKQSK